MGGSVGVTMHTVFHGQYRKYADTLVWQSSVVKQLSDCHRAWGSPRPGSEIDHGGSVLMLTVQALLIMNSELMRRENNTVLKVLNNLSVKASCWPNIQAHLAEVLCFRSCPVWHSHSLSSALLSTVLIMCTLR